MNYIKKIKSIGFKKIQPIIICEYTPYDNISGYYIKQVSLIKDPIKTPCFPRNASSVNLRSIQSYQYKVSINLTLYLIIIKNEYTLIVKDDDIKDTNDRYPRDHITKNNIYISIHSNNFDEFFWKDILSSLDKGIQRELRIKEIFSFS